MKKLFTILAAIAPSVAFAQTVVTDANSLTVKLTGLANTFIGILIALAVIFVIWHAILFIMEAGAPDKRKEHGWGIIWGLVGLAIILSIWGLVAILTNTFRTNNQTPVQQFPQVITPVKIQ